MKTSKICKSKLYRYQKAGIAGIDDFEGRCLLADEMGLGKTIQALAWMKWREKFPTVVICPASLKLNWQNECMKHFGLRAKVLNGMKPPKRMKLTRKKRILIINYEILEPWLPFLMAMKPELVILDEAHYLKNQQAIRTKNAKKLCRKSPHIIGLGGTPLVNRPIELYSILNIIVPEKYKSKTAFGFEFCKPKRTPWGGWQFKGARNLKKLHRLLKEDCMIRRLKKDVLNELPSKSRIVLPVEIDHRKDYEEAETNFLRWLAKRSKAKALKAKKAEVIVKINYLKRIAARYKFAKVKNWIDTYLEETNGKLVVFATHKDFIKNLRKRYKTTCVTLTGETTGKKRQAAVNKFQRHKGTRLFIGNMRAAGVGITLTAADTVMFAEMGWTPGEHTQAEDRIHRIGQTKGASCYYLIGNGTIEEDLVRIIQEKQKTINEVLDGERAQDDMDIYNQLVTQLQERKRK